MGRWDDWISIEAAMERQQAEDVERRAVRARRKALRVVTPDEAATEEIEAPEAVLAPPVESWPATKPVPPIERSPIDPATAIRLYVRAIKSMLDR